MGKGSTIAVILLIIVATLMYLLVEDETEWIEETTRVAKFNQLEKSSEELYRMRSRILSTCTEQSLSSLSHITLNNFTDRSSTTFKRQNIYDTKSKRSEYEEWIVAEFLLQGDELRNSTLRRVGHYLARFKR